MFTLIVTVLVVLQLVAGQNYHHSTPLLVISPENAGSCLSQQQRENVLQMLHNNTVSIIADVIASINIQLHCGEGKWTRVAYLNMSDPSQQCPSAWREYSNSTRGVRACGRQNTTRGGCDGTFYVTSAQYSKVCGRVIGYQYGHPDAFYYTLYYDVNTAYVDGVSITHGTQRTHIWTFAAGRNENHFDSHCPCAVNGNKTAPFFVGNNYYCESGTPTYEGVILYTDDLLWDGEQCEGTCCSNGKSPPWFSVNLPNTTSDDIEVRICDTIGDEDTPIKLLELYTQ